MDNAAKERVRKRMDELFEEFYTLDADFGDRLNEIIKGVARTSFNRGYINGVMDLQKEYED